MKRSRIAVRWKGELEGARYRKCNFSKVTFCDRKTKAQQERKTVSEKREHGENIAATVSRPAEMATATMRFYDNNLG